jgi:outer membrane murein-binding lipoprotein Lpp
MMRISIPFLTFTLLAFSGCESNPVAWWAKVNKKASHILTLEARHEALVREFELLKKEKYRLEDELAELKSQVESRDLAKLNLEATGSATGRRPAAIDYAVPNGITLEEMLALAYEHFREKRFAEAAVTFEEFLAQPEASALFDGNALYSAGVAWFQVGNLKKAREHLEAARVGAAGENKDKVRKKADLWLRVIDRKLASEGQPVAEPPPPPSPGAGL